MEIENLLADFKAQGLPPEQVMASLKQMLEEGKIVQEDYDKAVALMQPAQPTAPINPALEKEQAGKLFGGMTLM